GGAESRAGERDVVGVGVDAQVVPGHGLREAAAAAAEVEDALLGRRGERRAHHGETTVAVSEQPPVVEHGAPEPAADHHGRAHYQPALREHKPSERPGRRNARADPRRVLPRYGDRPRALRATVALNGCGGLTSGSADVVGPPPAVPATSHLAVEARTRAWLEEQYARGVASIMARAPGDEVYAPDGRPRRLSRYHFQELLRKLRIFRWLDGIEFTSFIDVGSGVDVYPEREREPLRVPPVYADLG